MSFDALGLVPELLRAVREQNYDQPTPVQSQAIPVVLAGRDLMAAAQTGSGKTAGFTLPLLQRLHLTPAPGHPGTNGPRRPRALVLVPTRELCAQVEESVRTYGAYLPLRSAKIFGGVGMQPQVDAIRAGVDILIATPGRLIDHVERRTLDLRGIEILVLDEADRMLDMGFIHAIKRILSLLPAKRQNLLFSATFADEIRALAERLLDRPESIDVTPRNRPVERIAQSMYRIDAARKPDLLAHFFTQNDWSQVLVFTRTKHGANRLAEKLSKAGISAEAIHGNKSQNARTRALENFKQLRVRALVATDIAARGLDIEGLPQVVNYELPQVPEDYVHRIGRTARAGADGSAMSLVSPDEAAMWRQIERVTGRAIPPSPLPEFAPLPRAAQAEPERREQPAQRSRSAQPRREGGAPRRESAPRDRAAGDGSARRDASAPRSDAAQPRRDAPQRDRPQASSPSRAASGAANPHGGRGGRSGADRDRRDRRDGPPPARRDGAPRGGSDRPSAQNAASTPARPGVETKRYVGGQVVFSSNAIRQRGR